jgi:hypothetical protein
MEDNELQQLLKRATEISKVVPESLRETAFNRAFEVLLDDIGATKKVRIQQESNAVKPLSRNMDTVTQKPGKYFLENLDRTSYPEITSARRVSDRSLYLLRIARHEFDVDGLGASDIARVLTERFRLRVSRQAVQQALDTAKNYVDKSTVDGRIVYRIMNPGEEYLETLSLESSSAAQNSKTSSNQQADSKKSKDRNLGRATRAKRTPGRPGPRTALNDLVGEGFFDSPRRIADIRQHLAHAKAHTYKVSDVSPTLVRMLRDGVLLRNRSDDGQYEYERKQRVGERPELRTK